MYSTCLFCHAGLGANDAIERFPVGRRLAFDSEKGRLWAVCRRCGRWNLTPIEERWEAIEACERLYRANPLRASTGNIGLARAADGTDLVRIGAALRPEIAAWRYGRRLQRRYFRNARARVLGAFGIGVASGGVIAGVVAVPVAMMVGGFGLPLAWAVRRRLLLESLPDDAGRTLHVTRRDLDALRLVADETPTGWALLLPHAEGTARLTGDAAARALGRLLVHVNAAGASEYALEEAQQRLAAAGDAATFAARIAGALKERAQRERIERRRRSWWHNEDPADVGRLQLLDLHDHTKLALEMSLHEETERVALQGELASLEAAWREAEEIAAIADRLLVPPAVTRRLDELRDRA